MKLHATISSERGKAANKSGNEYLEIEVKGERQEIIFEFRIQPYEDCYEIEGYAIDEGSKERRSERYFVFRPNRKGEHAHKWNPIVSDTGERVSWCDCGASKDSSGGIIE